MSGELRLFNRQRTRRTDTRLLRQVIRQLLADLLAVEDFDLTIHLVNAEEMTRVNETSLNHAGSTDVITFDYCDPQGPLAGELFICVDEALIQAARFRTNWQSEVVRYVIHGLLHLQGYDDLRPAARLKMKRRENQLVKKITACFDLRKLAGKPRLAA